VRGSRPPGKTARRLQRLVLERRYGMSPGALRDVDLRDIGFAGRDRVWQHIPSPWGVLRRIMGTGEVTREDVFIDIGCGMGAVLVEAAGRYAFRRVIGIDLVPDFTDVARQTIARARNRLRCQEIEIVTADVLDYEIPDDVTVVFLADPFRGQLFDAVIDKLVASVDRNPRRLRIVYSWPVEGGRLERTGRARLVRYGHPWARPWTTTPELAMYEIAPSGDGLAGSASPSSGLSRTLGERFRVARGRDGKGSRSTVDHPQTPEAAIEISSGGSGAARVVAAGLHPQLESLRTSFDGHHCLRLRHFLEGPLLERIQRYVAEGEFSARRYKGVWTDVCMDQGKAPELLMLLMNDPHLFESVRTITACRRIGRFDGVVSRMTPGRQRDEPWHGDIFGHQMVEMSIDLSTRRYSGGVLEIRDRYTGQVVHRLGDSEPGDATLVRLAPFLQHRVTAIEGESPRTVYAGRFMLFKSGVESELARPAPRA